MPIVKYQNHNGESVVLHGDGFSFMNLNSLRAYQWDFSTTSRPNGMGGIASNFARKPLQRTIKVSTHTETLEALHALENRIHAVTEPDVIAGIPGQLFVGEQYIVCYVVEGNVEDYLIPGHYTEIELTLLIIEPYWCTKTTTVFNIATSASDTTAKKFNLRFPYRFTTGYANTKLNNSHYAECPMIITIYGAAQNPSINIAGNTYNVATQIATGSRLVIDQTQHTIEIVNSVGEKTNVFNSRNKQFDIFKPLPAGESIVSHSGGFKFSIAVIQQRSGLKWTA